jgi:hypothetical protein
MEGMSLYLRACVRSSFIQANTFPIARPIPRQSQGLSAVSIVRLGGRPGWLPEYTSDHLLNIAALASRLSAWESKLNGLAGRDG